MTANKTRLGGLGRGLGALIPPPGQHGQHGLQERSGGPFDNDGGAGSPHRTVNDTSGGTEEANGGTTQPGRPPTTAAAAGIGAHFAELDVSSIRPNARQPREVFDEDALTELVHSVREFGVLQPVVVRPVGDTYELVMGERRLRAATAAGLAVIPAIVRTTPDDAMLRDALLENLHRANLNPLEEAAAYRQLLDDFDSTHEELAHRLGRSRPQVSNTIRLLNLPLAVQRRVAAGVLSAGHARALLSLDDGDAQDDLAARIVAEGLSVRATEELVLTSRPSRRKQRRPHARITVPAAQTLAQTLSDAFDTRVRVDIGQRKGRISVEFASVEDLERIVALMAPAVAEAGTSARLAHLRNGGAPSDAGPTTGGAVAEDVNEPR